MKKSISVVVVVVPGCKSKNEQPSSFVSALASFSVANMLWRDDLRCFHLIAAKNSQMLMFDRDLVPWVFALC